MVGTWDSLEISVLPEFKVLEYLSLPVLTFSSAGGDGNPVGGADVSVKWV